MKILILTFFLIMPLTTYSAINDLRPFATDYCSSWPEGTKEEPEKWANCCFTHDLHYWLGGTVEQRRAADKEIKTCVSMSGASLEAFLMYIGIRIGGEPGIAPYSWGFGWSKNRKYAAIKKSEIENAIILLKESAYYKSEKVKPLIDQYIYSISLFVE